MAKPHSATCICPSCGEAFEIQQWSVVNAAENPEQAEQLLHCTLFHQTCPHCEKQIYAAYTCLYANHEKKFAITLQPRPQDPAISPFLPDYTLRLEHSLMQFSERARILEAGLDDVPLEILRMILTSQLQKQYPERHYSHILFDSLVEDELYFQVDPQNPREQIKVPLAYFWRIEDQLKDSGLRPNISGYAVMNSKYILDSGMLRCLQPKQSDTNHG